MRRIQIIAAVSIAIYIVMLAPQAQTATTLKILNWNVWMGTDGKGYLRMGDLEDTQTRELRYQLQETEFKKVDADLIFLQELSPVFKRADHLAKALGMSAIARGDNCGLRIGNWGIPTNLQMGVAILAKPQLQLQEVALEGGHLREGQLPGFGWSFCQRWGAFQLSERRVYVAGKIQWAGQETTVVSTHLTAKLGTCTPEFNHHCKVLDAWESNGEITAQERQELEASLVRADEKRTQAVQHILSVLPPTSPVILAGDFNTDPQSRPIQTLLTAGFRDLSTDVGPTWAPHANASVPEQLLRRKELLTRTTLLEDLGIETDNVDRKIDYVFAKQLPPEVTVTAQQAMFTQPVEEHWLSDHFGVQVILGKSSEAASREIAQSPRSSP